MTAGQKPHSFNLRRSCIVSKIFNLVSLPCGKSKLPQGMNSPRGLLYVDHLKKQEERSEDVTHPLRKTVMARYAHFDHRYNSLLGDFLNHSSGVGVLEPSSWPVLALVPPLFALGHSLTSEVIFTSFLRPKTHLETNGFH